MSDYKSDVVASAVVLLKTNTTFDCDERASLVSVLHRVRKARVVEHCHHHELLHLHPLPIWLDDGSAVVVVVGAYCGCAVDDDFDA
jgi:hypothetical protein